MQKRLTIFFATALMGLSFYAFCQNTPKQYSSKDQDNFDYYFFEAAKYRATGRIDMALKCYMNCLSIDKNHAAVLYEVGRIHMAQGSNKDGIIFLQRAHQYAPDNRWMAQELAMAYQKAGLVTEAIEVYITLNKKYPENVNYLFELAQLYYQQQKFTDCLKALNQIEDLLGVSEELIVQKKDIYLMLNDLQGAARELEKLINSSPANIEYIGILAQFYASNDEPEKAIPLYERMIEIDSNDPRPHLDLSKIYQRQNKFDLSFSHLKIAMASPDLDADNKIQVLYSFYQLSFTDEGMKQKAYELMQLSLNANPSEPKLFAMYGDLLRRDQMFAEARNAFRKATRLGANQLQIWSDILLLDAQLGWQDSLAADGTDVIDLYPNIPLGYLMAGSALLNLKNFSKAISLLEEGLEYVLDNAELEEQFYILLADGHHRTKNHTKSDSYFEQALEINPNNPTTLNNYAYYLSVRGVNLNKALDMTARSNALAPNSGTFLDTWAWVLYRMGRYEQALEKIQLAAKYGGAENGEVIEHWGDILFKLNRIDDALIKWKEAEELGGASEFIQQKIKEIKLYE